MNHGKRQSENDADADEQGPFKVSRLNDILPVEDAPNDNFDDDDDSDNTMESDTEEPSLVPARLDWRKDPTQSMSDWTIGVFNSSTTNTNEEWQYYHVHRNVLVLESAYYRNVFATLPLDPDAPSATHLELHETAALLIPDLLDYMYGQPLTLNSENSTALHFLGDFFGLRRLRNEAKTFWQSDLAAWNVATYYRDAIVFRDSKVVKAVERACCQDEILSSFQPDSPILRVPNPRLWLYLVRHVDPRHSAHLSRLVARYCSEHVVDPNTFASLMTPEHLPHIDYSVTWTLLDLERIIAGDGSGTGAAALSSLQDRCIAALEQRWSELDVNHANLSQQSPTFLAELFQRTMRVAQQWHRHQETTRHGNSSALVSSAIQETTVNDDNLDVEEESEPCKGMKKYSDDDGGQSDADCRSCDAKEIDDSQLDNGLLVLKSTTT